MKKEYENETVNSCAPDQPARGGQCVQLECEIDTGCIADLLRISDADLCSALLKNGII